MWIMNPLWPEHQFWKIFLVAGKSGEGVDHSTPRIPYHFSDPRTADVEAPQHQVKWIYIVCNLVMLLVLGVISDRGSQLVTFKKSPSMPQGHWEVPSVKVLFKYHKQTYCSWDFHKQNWYNQELKSPYLTPKSDMVRKIKGSGILAK